MNQTPEIPHSDEAEIAVLSCCFITPKETIPVCLDRITMDAFHRPSHRVIYATLLEMFHNGSTIDLVTITQALKDRDQLEGIGDAFSLHDILKSEATSAAIQHYLNILTEKLRLRQLIEIGNDIVKRAHFGEDSDGLKQRIETGLTKIETTTTGRLPAIIDALDLIGEDLPLPEEIISGILHRGSKLLIGGASKSFKTWTLVDLAVSVATGSPWWGFPTVKGKVAYLNFEIAAPFFRKRLDDVGAAKDITFSKGGLMVWNLRGHTRNPDGLLALTAEENRLEDCTLIVVDPLYKLLGTRDENQAHAMAGLMGRLDELAVKSGAAIAFGSHFSKGNQAGKESIDRVSGSGVFARDPDAILTLTRHDEDGAYTVDPTLRNCKPVEPFVVSWKFPLMHRNEDLDPAKLRQAGGRKAEHSETDILALMDGNSISASDLQRLATEEIGISARSFYRLWDAVRSSGMVDKIPGTRKWMKNTVLPNHGSEGTTRI